MMRPVITITPSPCIDVGGIVPALVPEKKLYCTGVTKDPGGGGINVSRVITRLGGRTMAYFFAGGYTGHFFAGLLKDEKVDSFIIETTGSTRENFIVTDAATGLQYRFGLPGPFVSEAEWTQCLSALSAVKEVDYMVASGSLTDGIPTDFYARVAAIARKKKARLVLDTSGPALQQALEEGVYLVKPNLGELAFLAGVKQLDKESAVAAARELIAKKACEAMIVSMGAGGALLVTAELSRHINPPPVKIVSTVGAGDSMVAGIVLSLSKNKSLTEALQYGVACGTAATLHPGTALCSPAEVEQLVEQLFNKARDNS